MKAETISLQTKDPHTLGPTIERIIYFHEKNQQKQLKAQSACNILALNYEKSKKRYEEKVKQKQTQIVKRLDQIKKARATFFKKQSQHIQKVLTKSSNDNQIRRMNKLQKINQRNLQHEKHKDGIITHKCQTLGFFTLTQQQSEAEIRTVSNSLNAGDIKFNKYKKIYDLCEEIRKKSEQKQQKADSNRRMFQDKNRIKELNENKIERKIRANQQFLSRESSLIKKSVSKLEISEKRSEEHSVSQRKKSQQRKQKNNKSLQKIKKNRSDLELKLEQKLANLDKISYEKQKKIEQNKENLVQSWIANKKNKRLQKSDQTLTRFHQSMQEFNTKMNNMYQKDREQWGFLTKVNQFKDILIEKNVYQNHQLCLNK